MLAIDFFFAPNPLSPTVALDPLIFRRQCQRHKDS